MDVAYTEHSHVIGKGGGNIKKVMEVTSCHIHFPDSNRHNAAGEKSNQVTLLVWFCSKAFFFLFCFCFFGNGEPANNHILLDYQVSIAGPIEGVEDARRRIRVSGQTLI